MNTSIKWEGKQIQAQIGTLDKLTERYGSAYYLFNHDLFISNLGEFEAAFEKYYSNVKLGYSYKTNYMPAVCQTAREAGAYAEVVSGLEYDLALKVGYDGNEIIFNGPVKEKEELYKAFNKNSIVHFDSYQEITVLKKYLKKNPDSHVRCALRCNFDIGEKSISRFGFDAESGDVEKIYKELFDLDGCVPIGIHCHFSTDHRSIETYRKRAYKLINKAKEIFSGEKLQYVDIGGGFFGKMPQHIKELFPNKIPSYSDYGKAVGEIMQNHFPKENVALILEPGASVVANTMTFVCQVHSIKYIKGRPVVTLTGGQHNVRPTGANGNIPFRVIAVNEERNRLENALIGGYTCMETDIIDNNFTGDLSAGDYLLFDNMGAYNIVFKPPFIKGAPPVLMLQDEEDTLDLIRTEESLDNMFSTYKFEV